MEIKFDDVFFLGKVFICIKSLNFNQDVECRCLIVLWHWWILRDQVENVTLEVDTLWVL